MFWKKKKTEEVEKETVSFFEWAVGKDFFSSATDPWERVQGLLKEIQKRCLAEQVLVYSCDSGTGTCELLIGSPQSEKPALSKDLLDVLMQKCYTENRLLFTEDFGEEASFTEAFRSSNFETVLVSPLFADAGRMEALVILNFSDLGDHSRIVDFVQFVSTVLSISLQNARLYYELKKKNSEIDEWTSTVEKRIEEGTKKILEKEFQYYALFEGTNDGIIVHHPSGKLLECNHVASNLLGYGKKDLLELEWGRIVLPDSLARLDTFFNQVINKQKVNPVEISLLKSDGSNFVAEISSRKVRFRGSSAIQSFIRDVTARKALEERLRESKEKYQVMVESSLVGAFIIRTGILLFVNETFEALTGYTKDHLLERNFFDLVAPEDRSMVESREIRREKEENVPDQYEIRMIKRDEGRWWGEMRCRRIILDGRPAVLGNVIDITQRKQLEMQVLENQKMESIGTLAGGIAHDFNNLLGGILGYASLIMSDMGKENPYYNDIHSIAETAKRAADLTNRLLAFARGGKYRVTNVPLNQIVDDVITILSHTVDRSIALEKHHVKNLWLVKGDAQQLHQALMNICINAIEAMPGGGKLVVTTSNVILDESFVKTQLGIEQGDYVRLTVIDTGIGMDRKTQARLFEPFFTTKPSREGKGLGMSMVYGIVKNHEGAILVDSELGKGSKITIYLPRFKADSPSPKSIDVSSSQTPVVLLVDDETIIRSVGERMLKKGGFDVVLAENGKKAVELYRQHQDTIDVVLLDLVMPEMDGEQTYRALKQINPRVKVVMTSGYAPEDRPNWIALQENFFLQKPFQTEKLVEAIQKVLQENNGKE